MGRPSFLRGQSLSWPSAIPGFDHGFFNPLPQAPTTELSPWGQHKSLLPSEQIGVRIKMTGRSFLSIILLMICAATATAAGQQDLCPYKFITKTGIHKFFRPGGVFNLVFGPGSKSSYRVRNVTQYGILGPNHRYLQDDTVDVFFFDGPCDLICDLGLEFPWPLINEWKLEFFILSASYPTICDHTIRYDVNTTMRGVGIFPFNFCNEEVRTKKQNTADSLLRFIGGMPS